MPWTATFAADFQQFDATLQQAEVKLGQFEQSTKKTSRELQRMVSDFDGTKLTQQTQTLATAIEKVGGVTRLTEAEQKRANRTIQEAIEKYGLLGREAPAAVQKVARELADASKPAGFFRSNLDSIKASALGAFAGFSAAGLLSGTIGGLKRVAAGALETAGMLSDLSAQTGIQASALDRPRLAASPAGVALTTITDIATELGVKLTNGDVSVVGGVSRLGLHLDTLKASKPDAAFLAIVEGLTKIPDPMERSRAAFAAFGDKGKEVLRLVNAEFLENARNGKGWSDAQVADLDRAAQSWEDFGTAVETSTGQTLAVLIDFARKQQILAQSIANIAAGTIGAAVNRPFELANAMRGQVKVATPTAPTAPGAQALGAIGIPDDVELARITAALNKQAAAALAAGTAITGLQEARLDQRGWDAHVLQLIAEAEAARGLAAWSGAAAQGLDSLARSRSVSVGVAEGLLSQNGRVTRLANQVSTGGLPSAQTSNGFAWQRGGFNWGGVLQQGAGILMSGGNIGGGLGSMAGGIGGSLLSSGLGFAAGSTMGSVIPVLGTIVGGMLGKAIGGLFGPSKNAIATQQANANIGQTQAGLLSQFGSVEAISKMGPAGNALAAAWGSRGTQGEQWFNQLAAEFTAQVQKQNEYLGEQEELLGRRNQLEADHAQLAASLIPTWDTVAGLLEKYGISLEGAGAKVKQLATTSTFSTMINEMDTLERAGIEVGHMLSGMSDEISDAVNESIKFGTEIPANMKKYIQALIDSGQLLDENGEKITDITKIKFGAAVQTEAEKTRAQMAIIEQALDKVVKRLSDVADYLSRVIPAAAGTAANAVDSAFRGGYEGERGDGPSSTGYAAGGVVNRPHYARIGEGGQPEIIGPVDFIARALHRAGQMGAGGNGIVVHIDARGSIGLDSREAVNRVATELIDALPRAARRAGVRLAPA